MGITIDPLIGMSSVDIGESGYGSYSVTYEGMSYDAATKTFTLTSSTGKIHLSCKDFEILNSHEIEVHKTYFTNISFDFSKINTVNFVARGPMSSAGPIQINKILSMDRTSNGSANIDLTKQKSITGIYNIEITIKGTANQSTFSNMSIKFDLDDGYFVKPQFYAKVENETDKVFMRVPRKEYYNTFLKNTNELQHSALKYWSSNYKIESDKSSLIEYPNLETDSSGQYSVNYIKLKTDNVEDVGFDSYGERSGVKTGILKIPAIHSYNNNKKIILIDSIG